MEHTKLLMIYGGESPEHSVSIASARNVYAALDTTKYDITLAHIDPLGKWWVTENITDGMETSDAEQLLPQLGMKSFITSITKTVISPDVILPILHGNNGEDGTIQGLARLMHIPIVGCGVASSALCMDKVLAKQILEQNGIKTVPYFVYQSSDEYISYSALSRTLGSPLFIKPARSGSSVGVTKVENDDQLSDAIAHALIQDTKVLIEKAITTRELEVAVLGSSPDARVSGIGEIHPEGEFYSFDSKYHTSTKSTLTIPADIPAELASRIRAKASKAYKVLGCDGLARIDFFLSDDDRLYVNEVNTLPGFTDISMYPKLMIHDGMTYSGLIDSLITNAIKNGIVK